VCVEEALDLVAMKADEHHLNLAYHFDAHTPEHIMGDVVRVRQVLFNLISNAVKFTERGEVVVTVAGRWLGAGGRGSGAGDEFPDDEGREAGGLEGPGVGDEDEAESRPPPADPHPRYEVHLSVRDTGIGIPSDQMHRLFQSFSQIDASTARRYGGTGLGLAICKRLIEMMGGTIRVESEPGKGSTFYVTLMTALPRPGTDREPSTLPPSDAQPRKMGATAPMAMAMAMDRLDRLDRLKNRRVLMSSEYATNRTLLEHYTSSWGMLPTVVASLASVLEAMHQHARFDGVVLDIHTFAPGISTLFSSLQLQKDSKEHPPVVIMFVPLTRESEIMRRQWPMVERFLPRPIKPVALFDALADGFSRAIAVTPPPSSTPAASDETARSPGPLRILLAEDNPLNQKVALRLLERLGYQADLATNGEDVLESLKHRAYDVILMDVQMPRMDGLETTRDIRARGDAYPQPYIIAMTANAMPGDREQCIDAGMNDYVSKPVQVTMLRLVLERAQADRQP
jgi:CheY-like chemotaxis protein